LVERSNAAACLLGFNLINYHIRSQQTEIVLYCFFTASIEFQELIFSDFLRLKKKIAFNYSLCRRNCNHLATLRSFPEHVGLKWRNVISADK